MISKEDIHNLAQLARLELSSEEAASLQKDMSNILGYIDQISSFSASTENIVPENRNVMRADEPRSENDPLAGKREELLTAFPKREGDYLVVRKIIQKDE